MPRAPWLPVGRLPGARGPRRASDGDYRKRGFGRSWPYARFQRGRPLRAGRAGFTRGFGDAFSRASRAAYASWLTEKMCDQCDAGFLLDVMVLSNPLLPSMVWIHVWPPTVSTFSTMA